MMHGIERMIFVFIISALELVIITKGSILESERHLLNITLVTS